MRLSVSDRHLGAVLQRFAPSQGARLRLVVSEEGVDIAANAAGYLTLARWCMVMAHPEMEDHLDPDWLYSCFHLDDAFASSSEVAVATLEVIGAPRQLGSDTHQVRFLRSEHVERMVF